MLESVRQYLQDWSDACEYANECAPDLSFFGNGEPYTALFFIAAFCYVVWAVNEARIHRRIRASASAGPFDHSELMSVVEQMKQRADEANKLAA
jgi:hypothetical protein